MENVSEKETAMQSTGISAMKKTTTISTIAVQSGRTRLVIALLHVRFYHLCAHIHCNCFRTRVSHNIREMLLPQIIGVDI